MSPVQCLECYRKPFLFCLAFSAIGLVLTGAKEATFEWHERPAQVDAAVEEVLTWGRRLAAEAGDSEAVGEAPQALHKAIALVEASSERVPLGVE